MGSKDIKEKSNKKRKSTHSKGKSEKVKKTKGKKVFKIILVVFIVFFIICAGICAGIFFGLFGDDFKITKEDLIIENMNTVFKDRNGNVIANLSGEENRNIISKEEMPDYLPKAFVSIEDERFYKHHGVDIKRTLGATFQYIIHGGSSSYGGSTITQQLVKNLTEDKDDTGVAGMVRKVKEMSKAYQVERLISKDQILELYLNIIFLGDKAYGVEVASKYYFNKSCKDLDLAECAFLAGINHSPNAYKPFETDNQKMQEKIKNRTKTVLMKMKELGAITNDAEYNAAVEEVNNGLAFVKGDINTNATAYSYHTAAAIKQVKKDLMEKNKWNEEFADLQLRSKGYVIYSTEDTDIQAKMEEEFKKTDKYQISTKNTNGEKIKSQAAMVVIDHKTGQVLGNVGGLGTEVNAAGFNRSTQAYRQPGSTIKPIAVIAPGLENKVLTAGTVYADVPTNFGTKANPYEPKNDSNKFEGSMTMREAIERSQNIPEVKAMSEIGPLNSINFLREIGVSKLVTSSENKKHNDEAVQLALGGVTNGISPLEMAAAYAMIANDGEYIEPTFYTKVEDKNGNVVLEPQQERKRAMTEQNAYILQSILTAPVTGNNGTATYCAISGMDVAVQLALGGVTNGISPLEMAAAYAMIANDGEYIEPTFYTKVEDKNGNVVLEPQQERKRAMTEQNAYILQSILTAPVTGNNGTATYCAISGMDVAAKTGTTNDSKDRWLCGFTPYYTAATWYGYDENVEIKYRGRNPAGQIWDAVMTSINKDLESARFEKPSGIVTKKICKDTGLLASSKCSNTYNEIFVSGTEPKETCDGGRTTVTLCSESGKVATEYCTNTYSKTYTTIPEKEKNAKWKSDYNGYYGNAPTQKCTIHTKPVENNKPDTNTITNEVTPPPSTGNNVTGGDGKPTNPGDGSAGDGNSTTGGTNPPATTEE